MAKKTYIYTLGKSDKRGYNLCLMVYRMKRNVPIFIGEADVNTAAYKGNNATVCSLISREEKIPMIDGYRISGDVEIHHVGDGRV